MVLLRPSLPVSRTKREDAWQKARRFRPLAKSKHSVTVATHLLSLCDFALPLLAQPLATVQQHSLLLAESIL